MNIERKTIDTLTEDITITLQREDYEKKFNQELKKQSGKANLKGFRKGKTPASVVKKMYGKSVLANVINDAIQQQLFDYIDQEKLNILGQPIPAEGQENAFEFDPNNLQEFTFTFTVGLSPDLEVKGIGQESTYEIFDVEIDEETINDELLNAQKQLGTQESVDGKVEEKDILTIEAEELDGDQIKKDGWATEFTVMADSLSDEYKDQVLGMSKDDEFTFDIYQLEKDRTDSYVRKYLLNIDEPKEGEEEQEEINPGHHFKGKISKIQRLKPAEINQEFFDKYFGEGQVNSEEEARERVAEKISAYFDEQAKNVMYRHIMDAIMEQNEIQLPEAFLKRWLKSVNEKLTDEDLEKEFPGFLDSTKWTVIKSKLVDQYKVDVQYDEIRNEMEQKVYGVAYQYGLQPNQIGSVVDNLMQNKEEVNKTFEKIQAEKLFEAVGKEVNQKAKTIGIKDFTEYVKEMNSKQEAEK